MKLPRGIRNNNPGNLERNTTKWQGMNKDQSGDSRFIVFKSPEYGIRAISKLIQTYNRKYGLNTVEGIIHRYAPSIENNTNGYIGRVCDELCVAPDEQINVFDFVTMKTLVKAIIAVENGIKYADYYVDDVIEKGIALAGIKR